MHRGMDACVAADVEALGESADRQWVLIKTSEAISVRVYVRVRKRIGMRKSTRPRGTKKEIFALLLGLGL